MTALPCTYDEWRLATPWDDDHDIGMEAGDKCARLHEIDEDAPRGYRPKPCRGSMIRTVSFDDRHVACDTCGKIAE